MKTIVIKRFHHRGQDCIGLFFERDYGIIAIVKRIPGITFSITRRCWYLPDSAEAESQIRLLLQHKVLLEWSTATGKATAGRSTGGQAVAPQDVLMEMEHKLKLRDYSAATILTYVSQLKLFMQHIGNTELAQVTEKEIRGYLLHLRDDRKLSKSTQNQAINAIKFYFEKMLSQPRRTYYIDRPMKDLKLPAILSELEIASIFDAVDNLKHKLMLMIIYSGGLRRSELLKLHVGDVDCERGTIHIKGGKGRKDRNTTLGKRLSSYIARYLEEYKPSYWMFEGVNGSRYSATSLHNVFVSAVHRAGIRKEVSLHTLRHSFATHLLESGASTLYIQSLLGHGSSRTTEIYARVTKFGLDKIRSPIDGDVFGKKGEAEESEQ